MMPFDFYVSLLIFCPDDLSFGEKCLIKYWFPSKNPRPKTLIGRFPVSTINHSYSLVFSLEIP